MEIELEVKHKIKNLIVCVYENGRKKTISAKIELLDCVDSILVTALDFYTDQKITDSSSPWQKMENFGEKLKKWIFGLQNISSEMKSYQLSKRWKNVPLFFNSNV